jgi:hypothetical protein
MTRLLHQRGVVRDQGVLPADPKASLRGGARTTQASPLLRGSPGHGGLLLSARRDYLKPGCSGQDCQVVGGVNGRNTRLRAAQSDQIPDLSGFHRRMDGTQL